MGPLQNSKDAGVRAHVAAALSCRRLHAWAHCCPLPCSGMALFVYIGTGAAVFFSNPKSTNFGGWCCYCAGHGWPPLLLLLAAAAASAAAGGGLLVLCTV